MITTDRLTLRRWRSEDRAPYAAMMSNPAVNAWLGVAGTSEQALAAPDRFEAALRDTGFGYLAIERREDGVFLGASGLMIVDPKDPVGPAVEVGWRLTRAAWGFGYATEAARAVIADGFDRLNLAEIVAFTAESNVRSRAVMERLGMTRDAGRDFDHPRLAADHPLSRHVVYATRRLRL